MTVNGLAGMQYGISKAYSSYNKYLQQGSTGKKINSASDDAAGLAISSKMQAQISLSDQKAANALDSVSFSDVKEGALSGVAEGLRRMKTLASSASNSFYGADEKSAIQLEIDGLKSDISDIMDKTEFNGVKVFEDDAFEKLGIKDFSVTGDSIDIDSLDSAINSVSLQRAKEGATTNSLRSSINYLNNSTYNLTSSMSRISDTDISSLSTRLAQQKVMFQYKTAMQNNGSKLSSALTYGMLNMLK